MCGSEVMGDTWTVKRNSWIPLVSGAAAFLLTLTVGAAAATDWLTRNIEMNRLMIAIEQSENAMKQVQDRVSIVFDELDGVLPNSPEQDARTAAAVAELAAIAVDGEAAIGDAGRAVERVNILPWHTSIKAAQDAYLLHNYAWQGYMLSAQEDPVAFTAPQPLVNQTFEDSQDPLENAVPNPALYDLNVRVQDLYVEDSTSLGGPVI
jgi:hypothetical protein